MLEPDGRLHLRAALRPPPGFALSRAIATTFTLDLSSALVAPLAFAAHEIDQDKDPVAVMEAIRSVTNRVDIFCQAGNIAVPRTASDLMAFLEPMVHELPRPRSGFLFHPKVWLLRYESGDGSVEFRLVCGSRNLTPDTAWDAAVSLDGRRGSRPYAENRPIVDLVEHLIATAPRLSPSRRDPIASMAEELRRAEWDLPEQVNEIAFHAFGLGRGGRAESVDFSGRRHLVVAPFVEDRGVQAITSGSGEAVVVARAEQLERLLPATLAAFRGTFCVSGMAELGDPDDLTTSGPANLHGLHAKVICVERGRQAHLFIGSANATNAALAGNVEFMVELVGAVKNLGIDALIGNESGFRSILEPYTATGGESAAPNEELEHRLEDFLRSFAEKDFVARPLADEEEGTYRLEVTGPTVTIEPTWELSLAPLSSPNIGCSVLGGEPIEVTFAKLALADVGPFLVVRISVGEIERSTVIRAFLLDDPPDRLDAILARQVDTPEKLMRFLMLVLGLGAFDLEAIAPPGTGGDGWTFGGSGSGLFELVVRAVAERPEALLQVDRLLTRMEQTAQGRALLPDGLPQLWDAVRPLLPTPKTVPA